MIEQLKEERGILCLGMAKKGTGKSYFQVNHILINALKDKRQVITNLPLNYESLAENHPDLDLTLIVDLHRERELFKARYAQAMNNSDLTLQNQLHELIEWSRTEPFCHPRDFGMTDWSSRSQHCWILDDQDKYIHLNALFLIDEASTAFPLKKNGRPVNTPDGLSLFFEKVRHYGVDIYAFTQFRDNVSKSFTGHMDYEVYLIKKGRISTLGHILTGSAKKGFYYRVETYRSNDPNEFPIVFVPYTKQGFSNYQSYTGGGKPATNNSKAVVKSAKVILLLPFVLIAGLYYAYKATNISQAAFDESEHIAVHENPVLSDATAVVSPAQQQTVQPTQQTSSSQRFKPWAHIQMVELVKRTTAPVYYDSRQDIFITFSGRGFFGVEHLIEAGYSVWMTGCSGQADGEFNSISIRCVEKVQCRKTEPCPIPQVPIFYYNQQENKGTSFLPHVFNASDQFR